MRQTSDQRGQSFWDCFEFLDGQVNLSITKPKQKRGFHLHKEKWDHWRMIQGKQLVVLITTDEETNTDTVQTKVLEAGDSLDIEPGIWHAYQNIGEEDSIMLYYETNKSGPERKDDYEMSLDVYSEWK